MSGLNILFLGDVVGRPGRQAIRDHLPALIKSEKIDFVVTNGENAAAGFGITQSICQELYDAGTNVITLGNHTWDKAEVEQILQTDHRLIRPLNYPPGTVGHGWRSYLTDGGKKIAVINLMGRLWMEPGLDCPFQASRALSFDVNLDSYDAVIVDVHAETASEKRCLGHVWDGKASLVVGSHTHCPTADAHILPRGTGYMTDAGMCGDYNSSLGMKVEGGLARFEKKGKHKLEVAEGEGTMCGVLVNLDENGKCKQIRPIRMGGILQQAS